MADRRSIAVIIFSFIAVATAALALFSIKAGMAFALACGVVLFIFFNQFYGLLIYIVYALLSPGFFIPMLARLRVVLFLAITILLFSIIHHAVQRKKKNQFLSTEQDKLMFLLLLIVPMSSMANLHFGAAWGGLNEFLTVYFLYIMIVSIVDDYAKFRTLSWLLVSLVVFMSINGFIQHFRGVDLVGVKPLLGERIRWEGFFGDPNDFALLIVSFLPFALVYLFEGSGGGIRKIALLLVVALFVGAIYYTNSRGGFLALLALVLVFSSRRWGLLRGTAIGGVLLLLGIVFAPSRMGDLSPHEASAAGRIDQWITGFTFLLHRPVLGIGYQRFQAVNPTGRAAHSAYVNCFAELGLVGYFVWLALLYSCIAGLRRAEGYAAGELARYARILQLSFVGYLVGSIFLSSTYSPVLYILVALSALVINIPRPSAEERRQLLARDLFFVAAIEIVSIVVIRAFIIVGY